MGLQYVITNDTYDSLLALPEADPEPTEQPSQQH
jgi:hypothetical protein